MCCERVSYVQEAQAEGTITGTEQPPTGRSADRVRHVRRVPSPITFVRAVTLLYGAAALLGVAGLLGTAHLSLHVPPPRSGAARVGWLLPGGNAWSLGIRAGDRVLALDGRPPTAAAIRAWDGRQLTVRTHAGRAVSADAAALGNKSSTWPLLLLSPWFLLLGTLVYLRAGERGVGRVSYALFASAALALALAPGADADNLVATVGEQAAVPFFAAFLALFFLLFPSSGAVRARWCSSSSPRWRRAHSRSRPSSSRPCGRSGTTSGYSSCWPIHAWASASSCGPMRRCATPAFAGA